MKLTKNALLTALGGLAGFFAVIMTVRASGYPPVVLWTFAALSIALIAAAVFKLRIFTPLLALIAVFSFVSGCYLYQKPEFMTAIRAPIAEPVISQEDYHIPQNAASGEYYVADILKSKTVLINSDSLLRFIPDAFAKSCCCEYGELSSGDVKRGFEIIRQAIAADVCETGDTVISTNLFNLLSDAYNNPSVPYGRLDRIEAPKSYGMLWTENIEEAETVVLFSIENGYLFYLMPYDEFCEILNETDGCDA